MTVATAAWSADRLLDSLQSHGWGELDGHPNAGLRTVLNALVSLLPYDSAEGRLTRAQVADAAGITPKWAGVCLRRLEELGLITWRRGWLDHGQPRAGWIRLVKSRLAELVRSVKGYLDSRRDQRRAETRVRLARTLRRTTVPPWKLHRPLSRRGELSSTLPIQGSTPPGRGAFQQPSLTLPTDPGDRPMPGCAICGRAEDACQLANKKVPVPGRHDFEVGPSSYQIVAPVAELHPKPQAKGGPRGGWRALVEQVTRPEPEPLDFGQAEQ